jgi:alcohol dehydrogenase class IV
MGINVQDLSTTESGEAAIQKVEELLIETGLPRKLSEFNMSNQDITTCSELAMSDGSIVCNPKMVMEPKEIEQIFREAL